jgi:DNA-binding NtrC family response regulator
VNCGAIPAELFERELFGHEKGAFTGASTPSRGLVAEAEGGTLLLDEVETLSLCAQVKLLRFLKDQTYYALGSPRLRRGDVRIVSSTNAELSSKLQEGAFRRDLFYRLAVVTLRLPPLRERRADIPLLVAHFWARYADQRGGQDRHLSPRAVGVLCQYAWPGNVRELQNVLRQVAMLTEAQTIEPEDLPISPPPVPRAVRRLSLKQVKAEAIEQVEKAYVTEMLRAHGGNVTRAAREAQMERRAFGRIIKKYRLTKS